MKNLIKRLLRHSGYEVTRLDSRIEVDCAWGPNVLLFALEELAARNPAKRLNVVQIGANDGSDQDPLQSFFLDRNCEAILIEPMDQPFAALSAKYRGKDNLHTLQAAISERDETMDMHYIVDGAGEPALTLFSSLDRDTVERNLASAKREDATLADHSIRTKAIAARRLRSVLGEFAMQDVDAVVVDTEGFDHKIVRSFLEDGVEPQIIRLEYCNMSRRDFYALRELLLARGYEIARVGIDLYCQKGGLLR